MNKFPAAHENAYAAYKWVRDNAASIGINPAKIAVAGESAGGNMAAGVCLLAKERNLECAIGLKAMYQQRALLRALGWSSETGENWVVTSQTHGESPSLETATL